MFAIEEFDSAGFMRIKDKRQRLIIFSSFLEAALLVFLPVSSLIPALRGLCQKLSFVREDSPQPSHIRYIKQIINTQLHAVDDISLLLGSIN